MITYEAKRELLDIVGPEYYSDKLEDLVLYASDATNQNQYRPDAVIRPATTEEVARAVLTARRHKVPFIPRGSGSGLSGGALPVDGGIVCVMTRFNRVLEIDEENLLAVVEPGVVTARFQAEVEQLGLFYPPDPASRDFSSLGGNVAENAGGTRAVKYGVTRDYVLGLEFVVGTGEIIQTGVRTVKGVVGYDLTRLIVGSEGTLGVITKLILRLVPKPQSRETVVAYYADMEDAARTVSALTAARVVPATLEFMDRASINCAEDYLRQGLDRTAGAMLLIETDGPEAQARAEAEVAVEVCRRSGAGKVHRAHSREEAEAMWKARRCMSPAMFRVASGKFNEDIVVPRTRIPEMLKRMEQISARHGLTIINFGHAGDGNIHVNVMFDKADPVQAERSHEAVREIMAATLELGGTMSGEHGIGTSKRDFLDMEIRPEAMNLMKRIKTAFDPDGIMNPKKVFPLHP